MFCFFFAKKNIYDIKYKHNKSLTSEQDIKPEGEVSCSSVKGLSRGCVQQDQENTDKEVKYSTEDKVRGQSHWISRYNPIHLVGNIFHLKGIQSHTFCFNDKSSSTWPSNWTLSRVLKQELHYPLTSRVVHNGADSAVTLPDHVQG